MVGSLPVQPHTMVPAGEESSPCHLLVLKETPKDDRWHLDMRHVLIFSSTLRALSLQPYLHVGMTSEVLCVLTTPPRKTLRHFLMTSVRQVTSANFPGVNSQCWDRNSVSSFSDRGISA